MSHHERTLTPRTFNFTFADLPGTSKAFAIYSEVKTLQSFAQVARTCMAELREKQFLSFAVPKDLIAALTNILSMMSITEQLEEYIPILNFLHVLLSSTVFAVPLSLVVQLCTVLLEVKQHEVNPGLVNCSFALVDVLFHLALSRRKKTEQQDSAWIQKIFTGFSVLLQDLISKSELKELAAAEYNWGLNRISIESQVIKNKIHTDLVLYLVSSITQLVKLLVNPLPHDFSLQLLPNLLLHVINEFQRPNLYDFSQVHLSITLEKSISALNLLNNVCVITAKQEIAKVLVRNHPDKFRSLFFWTVLGYFKQPVLAVFPECKDDESVLGRLFFQVVKLFSHNLAHSDVESFPVVFFTTLLEPVKDI